MMLRCITNINHFIYINFYVIFLSATKNSQHLDPGGPHRWLRMRQGKRDQHWCKWWWWRHTGVLFGWIGSLDGHTRGSAAMVQVSNHFLPGTCAPGIQFGGVHSVGGPFGVTQGHIGPGFFPIFEVQRWIIKTNAWNVMKVFFSMLKTSHRR